MSRGIFIDGVDSRPISFNSFSRACSSDIQDRQDTEPAASDNARQTWQQIINTVYTRFLLCQYLRTDLFSSTTGAAACTGVREAAGSYPVRVEHCYVAE